MFLDIIELKNAIQARKNINASPEQFSSLYREEFSSVKLGCTFRPESFDSFEQAIEAISILKELGINEVRLGVRWSRVEKKQGDINLDDYKRVIAALLQARMSIALNIGPIKSAGWPEQFIPRWVTDECVIKKGQCIHLEDDITTRCFEYMENLLSQLTQEFGKNAFESIQPENECFKRFGKMKIISGQDYLEKLIQIIAFHIPNVPILLNSAGRNNVYTIFQFIRKYGHSSRFIVGYNYYFVTDATHKLYPWVRYVDDFVRIKFTSPPLNLVPPHVRFEVSECQFEKWGQAMWPGNNYEAFCYALWRCGHVSKQVSQDNFVVRLWGVEKFIKKIMSKQLNSEHKKIMKTIQLLKSKKVKEIL